MPYDLYVDLDPCLDVVCEKFAVCRAFGPYDARCVCVTGCPSIEQNVCASNGGSFNNVCLFQLEVCQTKANYSYYHHGSCRGTKICFRCILFNVIFGDNAISLMHIVRENL